VVTITNNGILNTTKGLRANGIKYVGANAAVCRTIYRRRAPIGAPTLGTKMELQLQLMAH